MEIKFINGSKIETIESKSKDSKRGNAFPVCFLYDYLYQKILLRLFSREKDEIL